MIIREYKAEDKEAIERCIFELQDSEYKQYPDFWVEPERASGAYLPYLIKRVEEQDGKIFVAEDDKKVVGFLAVVISREKDSSPCYKIREYAYITDLVVLKNYRGSGAGRELVSTAEEYAKKARVHYIALDVQVSSQAVGFYHKHGYMERSMWMNKKLDVQDQ